MSQKTGPLPARFAQPVDRSIRGADDPRCWTLWLRCGHITSQHRVDLPPAVVRCVECARLAGWKPGGR